jgi:D-amino-acid oxidase
MEIATVRSLDDALATYPVVVNCTGMGARELVPDPAMIPIRGQVVRVENPGLSGFTVDAGDHGDDISYVIPRSRDVVLGGTAIAGSASVTPDPDAARRIIERCTALEPALRDAAVIAHAAGIRPGRSAVRVEAESRGGGVAVHNYGHGGSGVTISWGCAEEAALLALTRAPASS